VKRIILLSITIYIILFEISLSRGSGSINVKRGQKAEVSINGGRVDIFPWNDSKIFCVGKSGGSINTSGGKIPGIYYEAYNTKTAKAEVYVPENINVNYVFGEGEIVFHEYYIGNANVSLASGNITADNIKGNLELTTGFGDINIKNVYGNLSLIEAIGNIKVDTIAGCLEIESSTGNIDIGFIEDDVMIKTKSGNINIKKSNKFTEIKTDSGNININFCAMKNKESFISSGLGDIIVTIPVNLKVNIDAKIEIKEEYKNKIYKKDSLIKNCKILSDFRDKSLKNGKKEIMASYNLNGGGGKIRIETVNSNIIIKKSEK
jgi:hypothetical protein